MDPHQPITETAVPPVYSPAPSRGIFGTGIPSTIAFALALLLFLLPFAEIKCGGAKFMNKKGVDFALNSNWRLLENGMGDDLFKGENKKPSNKEGQAPYMIWAAMGLAVLGLVVSLNRSKGGAMLTAVTGLAGFASLIGFMILLKSWFDKEMAKDAADKAKDATDVKLSLDFTIYLYLCLACFLVAAVFAFLRMQKKTT